MSTDEKFENAKDKLQDTRDTVKGAAQGMFGDQDEDRDKTD